MIHTLIIMLMIQYNIIHVAVSLGTLRLVSKTMAQQVPTLSMVIPYLELFNQARVSSR